MARRVARDGRISPLYALQGPVRSATLRFCEGDRERAEAIHAEWQSWHHQYAAEFAKGRAVPAPPYSDTLGQAWARPTS
jgi:hypothetical protein